MILRTSSYGQMCNRLYDFSTFIALSLEKKTWLYYPWLNEYKEYFEFKDLKKYGIKTNFTPFINLELLFFKYMEKGLRLYSNTFQNNWFTYLRLSNKALDAKTDINQGINIFGGTWFTAYNDFKNHQNEIREIFKIKENYIVNIQNNFANHKKFDIKVGIHIRRGDYKEFQDGIYYYDNSVYATLMQKMKEYFPDKKIGFFLTSNENIEYEFYKQFDLIKNTGISIEDLYSLSKCDYIIGPPSTFSMWASFYGQVPLYQIYHKNSPFNFKQFEVFYVY